MLFKIGVLKNFGILAGKHLCWSLLLIKFQALYPLKKLENQVCKVCNFKVVKPYEDCNFNKNRLQRRCFLVNISKFLRTAFLETTSCGCFLFAGQFYERVAKSILLDVIYFRLYRLLT